TKPPEMGHKSHLPHIAHNQNYDFHNTKEKAYIPFHQNQADNYYVHRDNRTANPALLCHYYPHNACNAHARKMQGTTKPDSTTPPLLYFYFYDVSSKKIIQGAKIKNIYNMFNHLHRRVAARKSGAITLR